ncbi:MAG: hypothetical protein LBD72_00245 [Puniceicoccales bacterium]|jgi:hypothetical protein|nr:hypothetical protein [Puniceicoccales bacterium]
MSYFPPRKLCSAACDLQGVLLGYPQGYANADAIHNKLVLLTVLPERQLLRDIFPPTPHFDKCQSSILASRNPACVFFYLLFATGDVKLREAMFAFMANFPPDELACFLVGSSAAIFAISNAKNSEFFKDNASIFDEFLFKKNLGEPVFCANAPRAVKLFSELGLLDCVLCQKPEYFLYLISDAVPAELHDLAALISTDSFWSVFMALAQCQEHMEVLCQILRQDYTGIHALIIGFFFCRDLEILSHTFQRYPVIYSDLMFFSSNPVVREISWDFAQKNGCNPDILVRANAEVFIKNVLSAGKPLMCDGYERLMQTNIKGLIVEENVIDVFIDFVLCSLRRDIATAGIGFIARTGLFPALIASRGKELIRLALTGTKLSFLSPLFCSLLCQTNFTDVVISQECTAFFFQVVQKISLKNFSRSQLCVVIFFALLFNRPTVAETAVEELRRFPLMPFAFPVAAGLPGERAFTCNVEDDKIQCCLSRWFISYYAFIFVGNFKSVVAKFQLPEFRDAESIRLSGTGLPECFSKLGATTTWLVNIATRQECAIESLLCRCLTGDDADITEFTINILCSTDSTVRQRGYMVLLQKFPDRSTLVAALCRNGAVQFLFPFAATSSVMLNIQDPEWRCADVSVTMDFVEFLNANNIFSQVISSCIALFPGFGVLNSKLPKCDVDAICCGSNIHVALLLLTSPDECQRNLGYYFVVDNKISLCTHGNSIFFISNVLNSLSDVVRNAGISYLHSCGVQNVECDGKIYKLEPVTANYMHDVQSP